MFCRPIRFSYQIFVYISYWMDQFFKDIGNYSMAIALNILILWSILQQEIYISTYYKHL
jgi:hypothetical protein